MTNSSISLICFCLICSFVFSCSSEKDNKKSKISKEEKIEALAEQEFEMTKDPFTNSIPRERLYKIQNSIETYQNKNMINLNWEERGPDNFAGRVRTMILDLNDPSGTTMWSGGIAGGLWKCSDIYGEFQWENILGYQGNAAISSIVQNPDSPNEMYIGTGEGWFNGDAYRGDGIYKSSDGGITWARLQSTQDSDFRYIQKLLFSNGRLFACTRDRGIQVSDDGGLNWTKSLGNGKFGFSERAADIEVANDGVLYAACGIQSQDGIYKSTDNGMSWDFFDIDMPDYERIEIAVAPNNSDVVYGLVQDQNTNGAEIILKTIDGGENWEQLEGPSAFGMDNFARNQAWYDLSIGIDPTNSNRIFIGGVDVLVSNNGGSSWNQISQWFGGNDKQFVHADQHAVLYLDDSGDRVAFSNDGGIWITTNAKNNTPTVTNINKNLNITQFYACDIHPDANLDYIIGGTQDNGTHRFTNTGINATDRIVGGDGSYCHIDQDDPNVQIASTVYNNFRITLDNWESGKWVSTDNREGLFINPTDYDDFHNKLYSSAEQGNINIIDVYSGEIDSLYITTLANQTITAIKVHPTDPTKVYLGTSSGSITRVDSLLSDNPVFVALDNAGNYVRSIELNPQNTDQIVVTNSNYGVNSVYYSDNGGGLFQNLEGNLPDMPVRWALFNPVNPDGIILATELGIWTTDNIDGENTGWGLSSSGLPLTRIDMLKFREADNTLVAATHGRGIYTTNSFEGNYIYLNQGYVETNENSQNELMDACKVGRDLSFTIFVKDIEADTLFFELGHENMSASKGIDFDYHDQDIYILPNEKQTSFEITVYGDYMKQGYRDFKITVNGTNNSYFEDLIVKLNDDERSYDEFILRLKKDAGPTLQSSAHSGFDIIFSENDSLWLAMDGEMENIADCITTRLLFNNSDKILESEIYKVSPKIVYISNVESSNHYSAKLFLTNSEASKLEDNPIYALYSPDSLTNFENINWQILEELELVDLGLNKNFGQFSYNGPGSYTLGFALEDLDMDGFYSDVDCDDNNPEINPDAVEIEGNGIDENCDGEDIYVQLEEEELSFSIEPNPTSDYVNISIENAAILNSTIYNLNGSVLFQIKDNRTMIDLSSLNSGLYIFSIQTTKGRIIEKVVKN